MTTAIQGIEIELGRLEEDWRKFGIKVKVHSQKAQSLKAVAELDPSNYGTAQAVANAVGVSAGALAEHLGKKYGDNIDPDLAAKFAIRAFHEECMLQVSLGKEAPVKVARIQGHRGLLADAERELFDRIQYYMGRGEPLTPFECRCLDVWVGRIHANSLS